MKDSLASLTDEQILALSKGDLSGFTDEQLIAMSKGEMPSNVEETPIKDALVKGGAAALSSLGSALDYAGGITRAGIANLSDIVSGPDKDIGTLEDIIKAIKADPTSSEEYLRRAGMPEGGKLSDVFPGIYSETGEGLPLKKGGALDPTGRGAAGTMLDVVTDPLTWVSVGTGAAAKIAGRNVGKYLGQQAQKAGEKIYKSTSAMNLLDKEVAKYGKEPVSDVLFREGVSGSNEQIARKASELAEGVGAQRDAIIATASERGAMIHPYDVQAKLLDDIDKALASKSPPRRHAAQRFMDETMPEYITAMRGGVTPSQAAEIGSDIYKVVGAEGYNKLRQTSMDDEFLKKLGRAIKEERDAAVKQYVPEAAKSYEQMTKDIQGLLTAEKGLSREAAKTANQRVFTPIDAIAAASGGAPAIASKKAADAWKSTWFRTKGGLALHGAGKKAEQLATKMPQLSPWKALTLRRAAAEFANEGEQQ